MKISKMNVELIDHMGDDLSIVNAARVSFDKESEWEVVSRMSDDDVDVHYGEPCKLTCFQLSEKDEKLLTYLAKHGHWSPYAHTAISLRVKAPIFVARQLVKHRIGGDWNEVSRRYVDSEPEFWFPDEWRGRPEGSIKQGSSGVVDLPDHSIPYLDASIQPIDAVQIAVNMYNHMLASGVAPEQARMILPQNMMTEWIWTGGLMFFARVCRQRLDPHAQQETREIAERIAAIVAPLFPVGWKSLMENP